MDIPEISLMNHLPEAERDAIATIFIDFFSLVDDNVTVINPDIDRFFALCDEYPEMLWDVILEVLHRDPPTKVLNMLAVGPLRIFLAERGESLLGLVEEQAATDPAFRALLGNVRQETLSDETWQRILACRELPDES